MALNKVTHTHTCITDSYFGISECRCFMKQFLQVSRSLKLSYCPFYQLAVPFPIQPVFFLWVLFYEVDSQCAMSFFSRFLLNFN